MDETITCSPLLLWVRMDDLANVVDHEVMRQQHPKIISKQRDFDGKTTVLTPQNTEVVMGDYSQIMATTFTISDPEKNCSGWL